MNEKQIRQRIKIENKEASAVYDYWSFQRSCHDIRKNLKNEELEKQCFD